MSKKKTFERDVESAYGSDLSPRSSLSIKKGVFSIQEPSTNKNVWCQWFTQKIREYMVLEALFLIILIVLLIHSYRGSSQRQETHEMISNLRKEFNISQKTAIGKDLTELKIHEDKKLEKTLEEMLKKLRNKPTPPLVMIQTSEPDTDSHEAPKIQEAVSNSSSTHFNAASFIAGATIDTSRSSSSTLNSFFRFDQSSLVLVDRPKPPADKAWCTDEKEPILTVNLAEYVNPTAVSYQHSNWYGVVPDEAPKVYDVLACLDYFCEKWEPLVSNCKYNSYGYSDDRHEQVCHIPFNATRAPIGKVQFRFRKNQKSETTCVSLIRIYAVSSETTKMKELSLKDAEKCALLNYRYHHSSLIYNYFAFKNCTVLYSKGCCSECPECCEECDIQDINPFITLPPLIIFSFFMILGLILLTVILCIEYCDR